jgi:hypothetical protein
LGSGCMRAPRSSPYETSSPITGSPEWRRRGAVDGAHRCDANVRE